MNRNYFIEKVTKAGFKEHEPATWPQHYCYRQFFKREECVIGLSAPHKSISITVYDVDRKLYEKFSRYSSAWKYVASLKVGKLSEATNPVDTSKDKTQKLPNS